MKSSNLALQKAGVGLRMPIIRRLVVLASALLPSLPAQADVVWPALYLETRLFSWWAVGLGLLAEFFFIWKVFLLPLKRAMLADIAANAVSTLLGDAYQDTEHLEGAAECYREALALHRKIGSTRRLDFANAVRPFAILKERTGDTSGALELRKEAHRLYSSAKVRAGIDESASHLQKLGASLGRK